MFSATWATSSSSKQYLTSGLIASRTFASGPLPSATPRIAMSRSVIMPTSLSFSVTGSSPASIFFIKAAALRMVSSGLTSCTSLFITPLIFIACPPSIYLPPSRKRGAGDSVHDRQYLRNAMAYRCTMTLCSPFVLVSASWRTANVGIFAYALADIADRVVAFEPNPDYAFFARWMLRGRAEVREIALSDTSGHGTLYVPLSDQGVLLH